MCPIFHAVCIANGTPVIIELKAENQFRLTPEELEAAITPKTKLLVLPFPNNPTGANYGEGRSGKNSRGRKKI